MGGHSHDSSGGTLMRFIQASSWCTAQSEGLNWMRVRLAPRAHTTTLVAGIGPETGIRLEIFLEKWHRWLELKRSAVDLILWDYITNIRTLYVN